MGIQVIIKATTQMTEIKINYFIKYHWSKGVTIWGKDKIGSFVLYIKISK